VVDTVPTIHSLASSSEVTHTQARKQSINTFHIISLKQNIQYIQTAASLTAGYTRNRIPARVRRNKLN
jgi:hypothetical protein